MLTFTQPSSLNLSPSYPTSHTGLSDGSTKPTSWNATSTTQTTTCAPDRASSTLQIPTRHGSHYRALPSPPNPLLHLLLQRRLSRHDSSSEERVAPSKITIDHLLLILFCDLSTSDIGVTELMIPRSASNGVHGCIHTSFDLLYIFLFLQSIYISHTLWSGMIS